jgi:hypothetical protein
LFGFVALRNRVMANECFQLTLAAARSSLWATQLKLVLAI